MSNIEHTKSRVSLLIFLLLTIAFLPNFEAPKNIFFLGFMLSWFIFSFKNNNWGGPWELIDTIFALWIFLTILIGLNAFFLHEQPFKGSFDLLRYLTFGWIISRVYIENRFLKKIVIVTTISILPIFYTVINNQCFIGECLKLNSVGHVNHTALYMLLVLSISIPYLLKNFYRLKNYQKIYFLIFNASIAGLIVFSNSRASTGLLLFILLTSSIIIWLKANFKQKVLGLMIFSLGLILVSFNPPPVFNKFVYHYSLVGDSPRDKINNFSYELFKISPLFGTGMSNYPNFDRSDIKESVVKKYGENWWQENKERFWPYKHPHSIYYAYLTGGGIVLLSIFLIFWIYISVTLIKKSLIKDIHWIDIATFNITISILVIGYVNTTLAHENAMLSLLFIGIYIRSLRKNFKLSDPN